MTVSTKLLAGVVLAFAMPLTAMAQSSDAAYCKALSDKYTRYVQAGASSHRTAEPGADIMMAMSKCQSDPASSIPTLEKALKNAKVDLPPRN